MAIDWLAAGLNPGRGHAVHPVAGARARRAAPAAVDDHAARLAGAGADLQGSAGRSSRTGTWRPTASSATRCCSAPTSCCTGRSTCRWARTRSRTSRSRARSRGASITSTAASRSSSRRPRRRSRAWVRAIPRCIARCARNIRKRATPRRSRRRARWSNRNARLTVADRDRLFGYLEGTGHRDPARARGAADRDAEGARPRWAQDVEVLRQHHRAARGSGFGRRRSSRPCRPIRRACAAPIPAIRTNVRCGICTRSIRTRTTQAWVQQGCRSAGHRLPRVQGAADREDRRGGRRHRQAGAGVRGESRAGPRYHRGGLRDARARRRATRWMRCGRPWRSVN